MGTVYRNLNNLYENGFIRKINNPNGGDHYDKTLIDHAHIYCVECNNMFDVDANLLSDINLKNNGISYYSEEFNEAIGKLKWGKGDKTVLRRFFMN